MRKIIEAEDILADARNCVECIFLAASGLGGGLKEEATDPLQVVADIASKKIEEAIALLDEYRGSVNARPVPPAAEFRTTNRDDGPAEAFFEGRSAEEIERMIETLKVAFPPPAPAAPAAARPRSKGK
jgi:hypothetical protein